MQMSMREKYGFISSTLQARTHKPTIYNNFRIYNNFFRRKNGWLSVYEIQILNGSLDQALETSFNLS